MKLMPIDQIYIKDEDGWGGFRTIEGFGGYNGLFKSAGLVIFFDEAVGSYQGSSYLILNDPDGDKWGFRTYGWGSCSGCDSLQAANSLEDFESLRDSLLTGIIWQDGKAGLVAWLKAHDWLGDWTGRDVLENGILEQMVKALGGSTEGLPTLPSED